MGIDPVDTKEDCLYPNIWTPAKSPNGRLPVMVWIYGGGFTLGSTSSALYNGASLVNKGVVLVSVAYRLGPLGFLAHTALTAVQGGHSGNYGYWIRSPDSSGSSTTSPVSAAIRAALTIFGESAGGISVSMLAASPLARGLFQGAISESGGNFAPAQRDNEGGEYMHTLARAEKDKAAFFSKLGVASIADARKISAEEILKLSGPGLGAVGVPGWPIFDGYVILGDQYQLYEAGHYNGTPVLIGTNSDEGAVFVPAITSAAYLSGIRSGYGEYADTILAAYPGGFGCRSSSLGARHCP